LHELRDVYDAGLYVCILVFTNKYGCWNVDCVVIERVIFIYMVLYEDVYVYLYASLFNGLRACTSTWRIWYMIVCMLVLEE